jgi:hypothetical protein
MSVHGHKADGLRPARMSASEGNADIAKSSAFRIYEYTP